MNKGYTPDELVHQISLPEHLATHPWLGEFYGTIAQTVRQIYCGELGWFQGDPTTLAPISPYDASNRYIKLMGGRNRVLKAAQQAKDARDYQWAAELATHIIRTDKGDMEARKLKAGALRRLGYQQMNINWRNWYLTSALELEGHLDIHQRHTAYTSPEIARIFPATAIVESLTHRLAAEKALKEHTTMGFRFPEENESCGLEIRRGVAEFHPAFPERADTIITLNKTCLTNILLGPSTVQQEINSGNLVVNGNKEDVLQFFDYFDKPGNEPITLATK